MTKLCEVKGPSGVICACEYGHAGQHWGRVTKLWGKKSRRGLWSNPPDAYGKLPRRQPQEQP
jgi:hypothetical protein